MTLPTKTFEVGRTYSCRSICDYDCIFSFTVTGRTEKTVTLSRKGGGTDIRRKVRVVDGAENCDPQGRFSMSPVLSAAKEICPICDKDTPHYHSPKEIQHGDRQ